MQIEKAQESLRAAELCFEAKLYNSTANRAYYTMFQAGIVALARVGVHPRGEQWSHDGLQSAFNDELIHKRKRIPGHVASYLPNGMQIRHLADYYAESLSEAKARRILRWAREFLEVVEKG